jgi:hypothetical protein
MDTHDERIALQRLAEPLLAGIDDPVARGALLEALWQERASLARWLLLSAPAGDAEPVSGH